MTSIRSGLYQITLNENTDMVGMLALSISQHKRDKYMNSFVKVLLDCISDPLYEIHMIIRNMYYNINGLNMCNIEIKKDIEYLERSNYVVCSKYNHNLGKTLTCMGTREHKYTYYFKYINEHKNGIDGVFKLKDFLYFVLHTLYKASKSKNIGDILCKRNTEKIESYYQTLGELDTYIWDITKACDFDKTFDKYKVRSLSEFIYEILRVYDLLKKVVKILEEEYEYNFDENNNTNVYDDVYIDSESDEEECKAYGEYGPYTTYGSDASDVE